MIEIYDISNGKLKYSAYTFWQLTEMVMEDFAYHTGDDDNDILGWIRDKARILCKGALKKEAFKRLEELLNFADKNGHRAFASRVSNVLGELAFEDGQHESAIQYSQRGLGLLPDSLEALHQLARAFSALGQHEKAAEVWRKIAGIFPSEEALLALAEVFFALGRHRDQERALVSLVRGYPRSIRGLHALAQFYARLGKNKAAARLIQRIVELAPEGGERLEPFFNEFAEALIWSKYNYEARKVDKVLEFLDEEQERNPQEWLGLLKAVMLYKLDRRLCREECCHELGKYFDWIGYEKSQLTDDLRRVREVFGEEFSRGVVRFINNQFDRHLLRKEREKASTLSATGPREPISPSPATSQGEKRRSTRRPNPLPAHSDTSAKRSNRIV